MLAGNHACIRADELYTLEQLKERLDLSDSAYRALRDSGLPEVCRGKRKYFVGRRVIAWFEEQADDSRVRGPAAPEVQEPPAPLEDGHEMAGAVGRNIARKGRRAARGPA